MKKVYKKNNKEFLVFKKNVFQKLLERDVILEKN